MADPEVRPASGKLWISVFVMILVAAILCVTVLPLAECPLCHGTGRFYMYARTDIKTTDLKSFRCMSCGGSERISCYDKWTFPEEIAMTYEDAREEDGVPPGIRPYGNRRPERCPLPQ